MLKIFTRVILFVFIYCFGLFSQGCNVINPKEQIPTYIHIDTFRFDVNPLLPNISTSHLINSVWVYYNNNLIGSYDLPATFPIKTAGDSGTGKLEIAPGIAVNGQNNLLDIYPFYQIDTSTFTIQPGKIINHLPRTLYYTGAKVTKISDFEGPVNFSLSAGQIPMVKVTDPAIVFEGAASGSISLNAVGDSSVDSSTVASFVIPEGAAFVEFNYKSDVPFYVGLQANYNTIHSTPYYLVGISPISHWQKFYVNVATFAATYKATTYTLYIKAVLAEGQTSGRLLLDNIQLVTF